MDTHQRLREAAERLALRLAQGGMQKTTARVMAALLYTQQESMTAADLGAELSISSGAVSTAVNHLVPVGLIERVPAPAGSRREHFRFRPGAWAHLMSQQNSMIDSMLDAADAGLAAVDWDSSTGQRLHEMKHFYTYMSEHLFPLIDRWREVYRAERD